MMLCTKGKPKCKREGGKRHLPVIRLELPTSIPIICMVGSLTQMKVVVQGKNINVTDALRTYAEKKVNRLEKFFRDEPLGAEVTLKVENDLHIVDITLEVDGVLLRGEQTTHDMYASIDRVIEKIERQIRKHKTKLNRKLRQGGKGLQSFLTDEEQDEEDIEPKILRTKRFAIKPMSTEEAVLQMDLLGHDFFVYLNADTEEVNVVYKRRDGNYGLIEPTF